MPCLSTRKVKRIHLVNHGMLPNLLGTLTNHRRVSNILIDSSIEMPNLFPLHGITNAVNLKP